MTLEERAKAVASRVEHRKNHADILGWEFNLIDDEELIADQAKALTKANARVAELEKALEYTEENVIDDKMNIKQVVRIALGKEPKRKVTFSNLGKYFGKQDKQE